MTETKGTAVSSLAEFIKTRHGAENFGKWMDGLTPAAKAVYKAAIMPSDWYDLDAILAFQTGNGRIIPLAPLTGKPILTSAELYADNKWLAACYLQWETFCQHLMESHPQTRLLTVEPASGPSEHFRLLAHPGQTPANNLSDNA